MEGAPNDTCRSGGQPIPLSSTIWCLDGFYCPSNNEQQHPVYCPPLSDCLLTRLQSSNNLCAIPQGNLEPTVCAPGFYCPPGGKQQIQCPSGHFCPLGAVAPFKCTAMSICPAGSSYEIPLLGIFLCLVLDAILIGWCCVLRSPLLPIRRTPSIPLMTRGRHRSYPLADESGLNTKPASMQQFQDLFTDGNSSQFSLDLNFNNIHLHLGRSRREILSGLQGFINTSSILGIIGPSGSGKSSFVNIISGTVRPTRGWISINGRKAQPAELRDLFGFIAQNDTVLPDMTVRENILYSGRVLLGGQLPDGMIQEYVDFILLSLGLSGIQDQLVGGLLKEGGRGISGGEYKRVSIALALAGAPRGLILDEPTSGLDATAAHSLMKLLHSISRQGIMVICVIHQPRVEIFNLLDDVLVLNNRKQVYLGKAREAQVFFEKLGQQKFPTASNPADVILDILLNYSQSDEQQISMRASLGEEQSPRRGNVEQETRDEDDLARLLKIVRQRRASWLRQLWLAFSRSIAQQSQQTEGLALEIISSAVVGLMIGLAAFESRGHFFQGIYHGPFNLLSSAVDYRLIAEQGLLCCLAIACAAGPSGVKVFGEEKHIFNRESRAGHSVSAYFLGKNFAVCFRMLLASLHFTAFYLVLAGPMISFRLQLGLGFLFFYCIYGLGFVVSVITRREDGPLLCMLLSLITSALSGCAPRLSTVRKWHMAWFWYCWPATWFSEAFYQENTAPLAYLYNIQNAAVYTGYRMGRTTMDLGFLILIGTLYRVLSYLLLSSRVR